MNGDGYINKGWVKLPRALLDDPILMKDRDHLAIYVYLLLVATHKTRDALFKGRRKTLNPGQLITGRKRISKELKISESKVQRVLKCFENDYQIEQLTTSECRLITITNWDSYQRFDQLINDERTPSKHLSNTKQELNNSNNVKEPTLEEVINNFESQMLPRVEAEKFWSHYDAQDWMASNGIPIKRWKSKVIGWMKNSKNFNSNSKNNEGVDERFEQSIQ